MPPGVKRSEKVKYNSGHSQGLKEHWYGFSVYIPTDWSFGSDTWIIVQQMRANKASYESERSPHISLEVTSSGHWRMYNRWDNNDTTSGTSNGAGGTVRTELLFDNVPLQKGVWVDWVYHAVWDYRTEAQGSQGVLEVWKDGVKVGERINKPNCYNDKTDMHFKIGMYKPANGPNIAKTAYYDQVKIADAASDYNTVAPEGAKRNVTLGKTVTVDSEYNSTYTGPKAVDGLRGPTDNNTRWVSADTGYPHWIEVNLGASYNISEVKFWTGASGVYKHPVYDYQIQRWGGSSWINIRTKTGNSSSQVTETFPVVNASRVRLYCTAGETGILRLYELEIYGTPAASGRVAATGDGVKDVAGGPQVYPNPARGEFTVQYEAPRDREVRLVLYNAVGQAVLRKTARTGKGAGPIRNDIAGLPAGLYSLRVECGGEQTTHRLVVAR